MRRTNALKLCTYIFCVLIITGELASSASYGDLDNLRDLYEVLLRSQGLSGSSRYNHEMVRKGGRSPSLRLRFGRRSDPSWDSLTSADRSLEQGGN